MSMRISTAQALILLLLIIIIINIILNINIIINMIRHDLFTPPTMFGVSCRDNCLTEPNHLHATTYQNNWVWVKIEYPNNGMMNAKNRLKSVVPQVLHFDSYPIINTSLWKRTISSKAVSKATGWDHTCHSQPLLPRFSYPIWWWKRKRSILLISVNPGIPL